MTTLSQLLIELKNTQTTLDEFGKKQIKELKRQLVECDSNLKSFEILRESLKESLDEEKNKRLQLKNERKDLINTMINNENREPKKTEPNSPKAKPEPPKTKPELQKSNEVKLPVKEVIDLSLVSDSSDSSNQIEDQETKKTKESTSKVPENGSKKSEPPSNVIQPPTKKMNLGPVDAEGSASKLPAKSSNKVQPKPNLSRKQKQLKAQAKKGKNLRDDKMIQFGNYSWGEPRFYKFSLDGKPMTRREMEKVKNRVTREKRKFEPGPFQCLCTQCRGHKLKRVTGTQSFINSHQTEVYKPKFSCVKCDFYLSSFNLNHMKNHLRMHEMDREYI